MNSSRLGYIQAFIVLIAFTLSFVGHASAATVSYNLRAAAGSVTMPDGKVVPFWGFSRYSTATMPPPTLPGPQLSAAQGDTLSITLKNDLPVPVSLVIPGQPYTPAPTKSGNAASAKVRVMSFTNEVAAGATQVLTFTGVKAGTYRYESGTNPAVQVPMGLYGALTVLPGTPGQAYPGDAARSGFVNVAVVLLSEILGRYDKVLGQYVTLNEDVVAAPAAPRPTVDYGALYNLINGKAYPQTQDISAPNGQRTLLRFINVGARNAVPSLQGAHMTIIAEDGNLLTYPRYEHSPILSSGKTLDAIYQPGSLGYVALYDRRLGIDNAGRFPGGMLTYLGDLNCSPFKGDVDGDLKITVADVISILRASTAGTKLPAGDVWPFDAVTGLPCGDGDGTISLPDVIAVLRKAVGANPY